MRVNTILHKLFSKSLSGIHLTRVKAIFFAVDALVHGGRLSLTSLGRKARSRAKPKHTIKRIDRLLCNVHLHREQSTFFGALARVLIAQQRRPLILVD